MDIIPSVNPTSNDPSWLQLRLTTCIFLMLVAAVVVWLNVMNPRGEVRDVDFEDGGAFPVRNEEVARFGWPVTFYSKRPSSGSGARRSISALIVDLAVLLGILLASGYLVEAWQRKRDMKLDES